MQLSLSLPCQLNNNITYLVGWLIQQLQITDAKSLLIFQLAQNRAFPSTHKLPQHISSPQSFHKYTHTTSLLPATDPTFFNSTHPSNHEILVRGIIVVFHRVILPVTPNPRIRLSPCCAVPLINSKLTHLVHPKYLILASAPLFVGLPKDPFKFNLFAI
jgi:hypothetical protein